MTSKRLESGKSKKPYVKPEFIQVVLRPEEAVLGYCKSTHAAGIGNSPCNNGVGCANTGS